MHESTPTPVQRLGVWLAAVLIFAAAPLAKWTADTVTGTPIVPTRPASSVSVPTVHRVRTVKHRAEEDQPGWDCTVDGVVVCGNGTGVDAP